MQGWREFGGALITALISISLMIGALSISLVEFVPQATPTSTNNEPPSPAPLTATVTSPPTLTPLTTAGPALSIQTTTITSTASMPANCQIPTGWTLITVQAGDTIQTIAARYQTTADILRVGNCLPTANLVSGTKLYVPPGITSTSAACTPGAIGWTKSYVVQAGDNLYRIGLDHYTTLTLMRSVNCKVGDIIHSGEVLWVPNVATRTPYPTGLAGTPVSPVPTDPLTETALPFTATLLPTNTLIPPTNPIAPPPAASPTTAAP